MTAVTIVLPWPPTANTYWRRRGAMYFISDKGIAYRNLTVTACEHLNNYFSSSKRLQVQVDAFPPDRRRRDLDNVFKCLLDSLQKAHVYVDDSQIDYLSIKRMPQLYNKVIVTIDEIKCT